MGLTSLFKKGVGKGIKVGKGVGKVAIKKGTTAGKAAVRHAKKQALKHANTMIDTSIRGAGAAASVTAGNPAPMLAAEGLIMGKDYLAKHGAKKLWEKEKKQSRGLPRTAVAKSHLYYPKARVGNQSLRDPRKVGIATQSHGYEAFSRFNRTRVNTKSAVGRNWDFYSSAGRPTGAKM